MPTTGAAGTGGQSGEPNGGTGGASNRKTVSPKLIISAVIAAVALWFILANTETARIRLFFVTVSAPVWLVLLITFVAGGATWYFYTRKKQ